MKKQTLNTIKRVAIYIRVSTDKQAKLGDSLREQTETLQTYINNHDDMILYSTYIDDGISGQKLNRDDFTRLISDVKNNQIDLIIFTKLDRWFRSLRHYLNTQATLEEHNVSWTAVSQPFFDTSTAHGRAFVAQSMAWAELEAQNGSERILAVFENKVKNGEVISGTVPIGFKIENKKLVHNEQAEQILKMFEYYQRNPNLRATMRHAFEELGIDRSHDQIRRILSNAIYKGEYRDNKNYCKPIVNQELWCDVNRLLARNIRSNKTHDYVFSGLIVCGDCNKRMSASNVVKYNNTTKEKTQYSYPAYRCQGYSLKDKCCNRKQFYETTLERRLLEILPSEIEKYIYEYELANAPIVDNSLKRRAIEKKIEKLKELYINDLITLDEYKIDRANYEKQLINVPVEKVVKKDLATAKNILNIDIKTFYSTMKFDEKHFFWRSIVKDIKINNNHELEIIFL